MSELASINPADGSINGSVPETDAAGVRGLIARADVAAPIVRAAEADERLGWICAVADAVDAHVDELVALAGRESGLAEGRLRGEVARTTTQLRFLATYAASGEPFRPTIDTVDPGWAPAPRPDLRSIRVGLGPIAVFAASNFPFAFSVLGGDTASAWAAGCPVVVKAHPGHPLLSERIGAIATAALAEAGAPQGMLAVVHGFNAGIALLADPRIRGGAFTGSEVGGRALFDAAAGRPDPIPFFAEMGSVNPVVLTRQAVQERTEALVDGLLGSFTLGAGQFCTKPGLVLVPSDSDIPALVGKRVESVAAMVMLTHGLRDRHQFDLARLAEHPAVEIQAVGTAGNEPGSASEPISVAVTDAASFIADPEALGVECFGPSTLLVRYGSDEELVAALGALKGSLTATVHLGRDEDVSALVTILEQVAGRILFNDWPTGVAVTWAQFHGGPYPATTDPRFTSVGTASIDRFLRTVSYQDAPDAVLPTLLKDQAAVGVRRFVNGVWTDAPVQRGD